MLPFLFFSFYFYFKYLYGERKNFYFTFSPRTLIASLLKYEISLNFGARILLLNVKQN